MASLSLQKQLQNILQEVLVPAARGDAPLILLEPPVFMPEDERVSIESHPALPLPKSRPHRSHTTLYLWPDQFLNALRVPYLGCVFEGEADIITALTGEMAAKHFGVEGRRKPLPYGRQTVSLTGPAFFLVPAGAPVSYGPRPHWERPNPQEAYSRVFWIHLLPAGAFCHTCSSSRGKHRTNPFVFAANDQLPQLSSLLVDEMSRREEQQGELTRTLLLSLLLKLQECLEGEGARSLESDEAIESAAALWPGSLPESSPKSVDAERLSAVLRRAIRFIEANLNKHDLSPGDVATQSFVSTSHLTRLFKAEVGVSIMDHVTRLRLTKAKALLRDTDIPISEVAELCGYRNPSHFTQLFTRHEQVPPRAFRHREQRLRLREHEHFTPR